MKKIFGLIMFGGAIAGANMAAPAYAMTGMQQDTRYYSDVSMTQLTGEYVIYCDGSDAFIGRPDIYSTITNYTC